MSAPMLLSDLLNESFPERPLIIDPWLEAGGLVMIYAPTGHGKTLVLLNVALSIAAGQPFLDMPVIAPKRVLYVDGEMPITQMQSRLRKQLKGHKWHARINANFALFSHAFFEHGMPPLGDPDDKTGRRMIDKHMNEFDVLILDNVSSLMGYGIENDAESWRGVNAWLIELRRRGKAVILVHHAGKQNSRGEYNQRGTSRRADQLDVIIKLVTEGTNPLSIHWVYEKHRSFQPEPKEGFGIEADFHSNSAGHEVSCQLRKADDMTREVAEALEWQKQAIELQRAEGLSQRQISERVGKSKSHVARILKSATSHAPKPGA